jgi:hypothetical protein
LEGDIVLARKVFAGNSQEDLSFVLLRLENIASLGMEEATFIFNTSLEKFFFDKLRGKGKEMLVTFSCGLISESLI